jgi:hypothetical protein
MVKTIPQLQIKKHLGNSHFCESIPRQKLGESNQQQQQPLILRVTGIKNPSRNSIRKILNFKRKKIKKQKSTVEQPLFYQTKNMFYQTKCHFFSVCTEHNLNNFLKHC